MYATAHKLGKNTFSFDVIETSQMFVIISSDIHLLEKYFSQCVFC